MTTALIDEYLELTGSELDAVIAEAEAARNLADAQIAAAASVVAARQHFRDDGYQSIRTYLKGTLNCSGTRANRIRKQAALVDQHPTIGDTWIAGHVGTEQVDVLASARAHPRAGDRFREFEPKLLDHAEHLEFDELTVVVKRFVTLADTDGAFDEQRFRDDERSAQITAQDGAVDVRASGGSPLAAEEMAAIFALAVEAEFDKDCAARRAEFGDEALAHPLPRTARQRKFDALHRIFLAWAAVPAGAKTPDPLVNLVIDPVTAGQLLAAHGLVDDPDLFGVGPERFAEMQQDLLARRCETTTGTAVHPDVALRALITGRIRRVVVDADSVVVDMGRTSRLFSGSSRDAAQLLVRTCTHRGCDIPAKFCDVDHRREWVSENGPTDQANAMPACGPHDRWKHANRIRTRRATNNRIYLIRPDGTTIKPAHEREPEWSEPPPFGTSESESGPSTTPNVNVGRTIPWSEFVKSRPHLADVPDLGWTILPVDISTGR